MIRAAPEKLLHFDLDIFDTLNRYPFQAIVALALFHSRLFALVVCRASRDSERERGGERIGGRGRDS